MFCKLRGKGSTLLYHADKKVGKLEGWVGEVGANYRVINIMYTPGPLYRYIV